MSGSEPSASGGRGSEKRFWAAVRDGDEVRWVRGRGGRQVEMMGASPLLSTSWELFIMSISVLSVVNIAIYALPVFPLGVRQVVYVADLFLTIPLLVDFLARLRVAPDRRAYLTRGGGIIDVLGSLPLPLIRILRLLRVQLVARRLGRHGSRGVVRALLRDPAAGTFLAVLLLTFVIIQFGSAVMLTVEESAQGANITSASDALWFSYETVTTVGYGDVYPVTNAGRLVGAVTLTLGIGVFAAFTGYLANVFLGGGRREDSEGRWAPEGGTEAPAEGSAGRVAATGVAEGTLAASGRLMAATGDEPLAATGSVPAATDDGPAAATGDGSEAATRDDVAALRAEIVALRRAVAALGGGGDQA